MEVAWGKLGIGIGVLLLLVGIAIGVYFLVEFLTKKNECSASSPCPAGKQCVGGQCLTQGCDANNLCPPGFVCINGSCQTPQCTDQTPCQGAQICVNGQCVDPQPCGATNPCPPGQVCLDGQCIVPPTYVKDIIATTSPNCPVGYVAAGIFADSNGDLKQRTGGNTPTIFLCLKKDNDPSTPPLTNLTVFQFPNGPERACPGANSQRITYRYQGNDEYDFEKGCGINSPVSKLCATYGESGVIPISDVVVTSVSSNSVPPCPEGYSRYNIIDDTNTSFGIPGDLNRLCGGYTVMLCVRRD